MSLGQADHALHGSDGLFGEVPGGEAARGKGSHITIYYGPRKTVVKDRRKELSPGLLSAMARQLALTNDDLR